MINSTDNNNILLTGLTGFVGSNLIKLLLNNSNSSNNNNNNNKSNNNNNNNKVFALVREKSSNSSFINELKLKYKDNFKLIIGDFIDLESSVTSQSKPIEFLRKVVHDNQINIIIHLASQMDFYPSERDFSNLHKTNVIGTENLLKASVNIFSDSGNSSSSNKNGNIKRFIYCSTTETMGGKKPVTGIPVSEYDDPYTHPNFYYGETKRLAEDHVRRFEKKYGLDTIILRPTGLYGKNDNFSIFELIQAVSYGIMFFIPSFANGSVMYTHVDDFNQAILLSIKKERSVNDDKDGLPYTYIISPDKGMSYKDCIIFLNEKLNRMKPRLRLPASICYPSIKVIGFFMYLGGKKKFLFKTDTLKRMEEDRLYSNERAKRELGYKPQYTLKQGLNVTIEEYLENERIGFYSISPLFVFTTIILLIIKFLIL